jgi:hypothetical protein
MPILPNLNHWGRHVNAAPQLRREHRRNADAWQQRDPEKQGDADRHDSDRGKLACSPDCLRLRAFPFIMAQV